MAYPHLIWLKLGGLVSCWSEINDYYPTAILYEAKIDQDRFIYAYYPVVVIGIIRGFGSLYSLLVSNINV